MDKRSSSYWLSQSVVNFGLAIGLLLAAAGNACSLHAQQKIWGPYTELDFQGGGFEEIGTGRLVLPVAQGALGVVYADLVGDWTDASSTQGSVGFVFRRIFNHRFIFGLNGYYDYFESPGGNQFERATVGLELYGNTCEFRINGYLPDDNPIQVGATRLNIVDNRTVLETLEQRAYGGLDLELGKRVAVFPGTTGNELRGYFTAFHHEAEADGFDAFTGTRLRMESRIYDLPMLGIGSRLVMTGGARWDDERGTVGEVVVAIRIPIGRPSLRVPITCGLKRRIQDTTVRERFVTNTAFRREDAVVAGGTGQRSSHVAIIDASTNSGDLENIFQDAGPGSLVIADGSRGAIQLVETIDLSPSQILSGGGQFLKMVGVESGRMFVFQTPGIRPTFFSTATNSLPFVSFSMASDSSLIGIDIDAIRAVTAQGRSGMLIKDTRIDAFRSTGLELTDSRDVTLDNVLVRGGNFNFNPGLPSPVVFDDSQVHASDFKVATNGGDNAFAVQIINGSNVQMDDSKIATTGANGVVVSSESHLGLNRSRIATNSGGPDEGIALSIELDSTFEINESLLIAAAQDANPLRITHGSGVVRNSELIARGGVGGSRDNEGVLIRLVNGAQVSFEDTIVRGENNIDQAIFVESVDGGKFSYVGGSVFNEITSFNGLGYGIQIQAVNSDLTVIVDDVDLSDSGGITASAQGTATMEYSLTNSILARDTSFGASGQGTLNAMVENNHFVSADARMFFLTFAFDDGVVNNQVSNNSFDGDVLLLMEAFDSSAVCYDIFDNAFTPGETKFLTLGSGGSVNFEQLSPTLEFNPLELDDANTGLEGADFDFGTGTHFGVQCPK